MLKEEKQKLDDDIKKSEQKLKTSIAEWEKKIDSRRKELVEHVKNREKYVEQKEKLEKELEEQIKGIELWEKNGINATDVLYRRRKDVIIPNLENQIKDIDLILDEASIREEYKALGELKKQIKDIKLHDRKHIIPELAEIFEITKDEPEPVEPEPVEPEPVEPEPVEPEPVEPEPVEPEPVEPEPVEPEPVEPEPVEPEPVEQKPVEQKPVEQKPVEQKPVEQKPDEQKPVEQKPAEQKPVEQKPVEQKPAEQKPVEQKPDEQKPDEQKKYNFDKVKLIIGRKIKLEYEDGTIENLANAKEYFKYVKRYDEWEEPETMIYEELQDRLGTDGLGHISSELDKIDPIIAFGFLQGLEKGTLLNREVLSAIKAIVSKDREELDKTLPIKWDKTDLSKGAFWPWNRKNRDIMAEHADKNADIMEVSGEYEPNPLKRFAKKVKQALPSRKKPEQITDGKKKGDEDNEKENLSIREKVKLSESYLDMFDEIQNITNKEEAKEWLKIYESKKNNGELSSEEAKVLHLDLMEKLHSLVEERKYEIANPEEPKKEVQPEENEI